MSRARDKRDLTPDSSPARQGAKNLTSAPPTFEEQEAESGSAARSGERLGEGSPTTQQAQALGAFLRGIADRAEADPAFAATLTTVAQQSGVTHLVGGTPTAHANAPDASSARAPGPSKAARRSAKANTPQVATPLPIPSPTTAGPPDPFRLMRDQGEEGLRATLAALDLMALRQIVRTHRLDPARISARWTTRERVIALIIDQVRARLNHGRSFERV